MRRSFVLKSTIAAALALGPIYWFPSVSFAFMFAARATLLLTLMLLSIWGTVRFHRRLILISVLLFSAAVLSSAIHMDLFFLSISPAVVILLIGSQLASRINLKDFLSAIFISLLVFSIFCCVVLFDFISGGVIADPFYNNYTVHLYSSGFNGGRTAWGYASNLFLALALQDGLSRSGRGRIGSVIRLLLVLVIFANILVTGARGAFLVSIALFVVYFFISNGTRKLSSAVTFGAVAVVVAIYIFSADSAGDLRLISTVLTTETRDLTSAGLRMDTYAAAFHALSFSPLIGAGSITIDTGLELLQVHNVWLRLIAERGILFALILFFFLWVVWLTSSRAARRNGCELRLLIASGILTGLVEPNAIFGNYFASVVFWAPIAFFLGSSGFRVRDPDKNG